MIDKLLRAKTVAAVAAAVLLAGGVAYAATDTGSRPAISQDEVSSTSTSVDQATSTSVDDDTSTTVTTESPSTTVAPGGATTTTEPEHAGDHHDNHGACVSQAAHETEPGEDHGKTVSGVAQSDCGKDQAQPGTTATTANDNEGAENENEAPEQQNAQQGDNSGHGNSSSGHGDSGSSDHGGPGRD